MIPLVISVAAGLADNATRGHRPLSPKRAVHLLRQVLGPHFGGFPRFAAMPDVGYSFGSDSRPEPDFIVLNQLSSFPDNITGAWSCHLQLTFELDVLVNLSEWDYPGFRGVHRVQPNPLERRLVRQSSQSPSTRQVLEKSDTTQLMPSQRTCYNVFSGTRLHRQAGQHATGPTLREKIGICRLGEPAC